MKLMLNQEDQAVDYGHRESCGDKKGQAPHSCPWQQDVHDDDDYRCNCCDDCINECAMDI